ncbi:MAG: O-methyltransferase, partial [Gemmatimonadetes bacterium]|nr:O-methyltransferase [Gemmatimonadota bacterium]
LEPLAREKAEPFDIVFIDADKNNYPGYLEGVLALSRPGTVIVGDNVVRGGEVVNPASSDPNVPGVRAFSEMIAREPRLSATVIQTVGVKGYDGLAIAIVTE